MKIRKYAQPEFERDCEIIANNVKRSGQQYDLILALGRGGIPAGTKLAHLLSLPMYVVNYSLKDSNRGLTMLDLTNQLDSSSRILVVDDISDSGNTLQEVVNLLDGWFVHTATLLFKPQTSRFRPTYLATIHMGDDWVEFFWEEPLIAK